MKRLAEGDDKARDRFRVVYRPLVIRAVGRVLADHDVALSAADRSALIEDTIDAALEQWKKLPRWLSPLHDRVREWSERYCRQFLVYCPSPST